MDNNYDHFQVIRPWPISIVALQLAASDLDMSV